MQTSPNSYWQLSCQAIRKAVQKKIELLDANFLATLNVYIQVRPFSIHETESICCMHARMRACTVLRATGSHTM